MGEQFLRAREYRRLSDAKGGTSLEDQGVDNTDAADEQGWDLGEPYIDNGLSASRYARKNRADFDQLVSDLKSGPTGRESQFGADVLMLWESSRGSRRVGEWVSFIELCEEKKVKIWVTTHERLYDPANGRDRKALIDDAVDSEYESYKTHRRVSRTTPKEARKGRPHGEAPYGLTPVYDTQTGKLLTWAEDPKRAPVIRELFDRLEAGHSFAAIVREFRDRGYVNKSGRPFTHGHLRQMVIRHSYAGLRYYKGAVYEGVWDGLVSQEQFWNVHRLVTSPGRASTRSGNTVHELTAGLLCSRCQSLFAVRYPSGRRAVYRCMTGCMKIDKEGVDDLFIGSVEHPGLLPQFLARDDIYSVLSARGDDDPEVSRIRSELAAARADLEETRQTDAESVAEERRLARREERLEACIEELEDQERALTLPPAVLKIIRPGMDVWQAWQAAPVSARREVVRTVFSPHHLGRIFVLPSPTRGRYQPIAERIELRRAG